METALDCSGVRGCRCPRCPEGLFLVRRRRTVLLLGGCDPSAPELGPAGAFGVRRAPPSTPDAVPTAHLGRGGALATAAPEPRFFGTNRPERLRGFPKPGLDSEPGGQRGGTEKGKEEIRGVPPAGVFPEVAALRVLLTAVAL